MTHFETTSALMSEVGSLADFLAISEYGEQKIWRMLVEEGLEILVELDDAQGLLVFTGDIMIPDVADPAPLYRMLLEYSRQWTETGGIHMAMESDGLVVAVFRAPVAGLERTMLARMLRNFAGTVAAWRTIITEHQNRRGASTDETPIDLMPETAIRV